MGPGFLVVLLDGDKVATMPPSETTCKAQRAGSPRLAFAVDVMAAFTRNRGQGFGAVAFSTILSLLPLAIVIAVMLSTWFNAEVAAAALDQELRILFAGNTETVRAELLRVATFRGLFGWLGSLFLLIQSTIACSTTKQAMEAIFGQTERTRPWYVSLPAVRLRAVLGADSVLGHSGSRARQYGRRGTDGLARLHRQRAQSGSVVHGLPPIHAACFRGLQTCRRFWLAVAMSWNHSALVSAYFRHVSAVGLLYGSLSAPLVMLFGIEVLAIILIGSRPSP